MLRPIGFFPTIFTGRGPAYTAMALAEAMARLGDAPQFVSGWALKDASPGVTQWAAYRIRLPFRAIVRLGLGSRATRQAERHVLDMLERRREPTCLQLWPGASPEFVARAREAGAVVFREMINTHVGTAKRILDAESARLGLPPQHAIGQQTVEDELRELAACDFVVSPSDGVDASLAEIGVPDDRIVRTTFGWSPERFAGDDGEPARRGGLNALFVGLLSVRKGTHLALEAWRRADLPGRFVLVGAVERDFRPILAPYLASGRVEHHPYTSDIASFYKTSDFLLFPTLEEGAPLICYEAAGNGLPIVTTAMGSARIVEDRRNGLIVDAHDIDGIAASIAAMGEVDLRRRMSREARASAAACTWRDAARTRLDAFARRMPSGG